MSVERTPKSNAAGNTAGIARQRRHEMPLGKNYKWIAIL
jgi:hypothetical protein